MEENYRVVYWVEGTIKVTAPTTYADAYNTAKSWNGEVYEFVTSFKDGAQQKKKGLVNG